MKLIIKHILIVDSKNQCANKFQFGNGANIFLSDDNEVGKSSLLKSMYYTLGGDVKSFTAGWNFREYIFQIECDIDGRSVTIQRFDKIFLTKINGTITTFADEKEFSSWLQKQMGMNLQLQVKNSEKYHVARMNAVLAPFYIDQDQSWAAFYRDSFDSLAMYKDQPKVVFEYYLQLSSNELIKLGEKLKALSSERNEVSGQLRQVEGVRSSYSTETDTDAMTPGQYDELKAEVDNYIGITNKLQNQISAYSSKVSKTKMNLDAYQSDYSETHKLLLATNNRFKNVGYECTYCHSQLTREQSLTRLELGDNDFEIRQREIELKHKVTVYQDELDKLLSKINELKSKFEEKNRRINAIRNSSNVDSYVDHQILTKLDQLSGKYQASIAHLDSNISNMKKEQREERATLKATRESEEHDFERIKNEIALELGVLGVSGKHFLNFQKVKDAGTALNKILLCLYLTYFEMLAAHSNTLFPMAIDSFVKNEITNSNEDKMFTAVQRHFMSLNNQTFFSLIKRNQGKIDLTQSAVTVLEKPILKKDDYKKIISELIVPEK